MNNELKEAIQKLSGTFLKDGVHCIECTVDSVDEDAFTCDCTAIGGTADTKIPGVRLAAESNDGFTLIPSVDSTVLVTYTDRGLAFISMFSDIDKVIIIINKTKFKIEDGKITFNDGSFDGLVKVIELTDKLNNLENKVNDLINSYVVHTHPVPGVTVGAGSTTSSVTVVTPPIDPLTVTQQADIENDLILHGE